MTEPAYQVVWPLGKLAYKGITPGTRISDFRGKTICELWDWLFKGEDVFPILRELLRRRFPDIKFVDYTVLVGQPAGKRRR